MGQQNLYENCIVKIYTQRARGGSEREREKNTEIRQIDRERKIQKDRDEKHTA